VVLAEGTVKGMVPKIALPNYGEFYDRRWFTSGDGVDEGVEDSQLGSFRVCTDQLFKVGDTRFGIEICEDLWAPLPPGIRHSLAGAELILNLSASNELIAKAEYRRDLVHMASARGICGYVYASSGPMESTKDVVFGGHLLACENGQALAEGPRFALDGATVVTEMDFHRLRHDRMQHNTFANAPRPVGYHYVETLTRVPALAGLNRTYPAHPFVPQDEALFDARAAEILAIQTTGLARRVLAAHSEALVIGLSGGLDSTLAFLVCLDVLKKLGRGPNQLHALTLPGPGTSEHTLESARRLCRAAGVVLREISITPAVRQHLSDLAHASEDDVVFENAQARERTQILFNTANKVAGLVVGTGDLSELALGWCTFNADHMSSYNVNVSVPKTMMSYLVRWYGAHRATAALAEVLERILSTPISPELIAPESGSISQETEAIIGPYELHDFFLFHFVRNGAGPAKIYHLARLAFAARYDDDVLRKWLKVFFQRFFSQQFKRTTLPPGPKVGSVSLSPRGDWRMPDEASAARLLEEIDAIETHPAP
jgi:NAD+ synthase (glutamine-hydrolysing)